MTYRAEVLTTPTTDPGIVAALVYIGDQLATLAAAGGDAVGRDYLRTRPNAAGRPVAGSMSAEQGEREESDERAAGRHPGPRKALLDDIDRRNRAAARTLLAEVYYTGPDPEQGEREESDGWNLNEAAVRGEPWPDPLRLRFSR